METDADKLQLAQPRSESCIREVQTEVVCTGNRTWKIKRKGEGGKKKNIVKVQKKNAEKQKIPQKLQTS